MPYMKRKADACFFCQTREQKKLAEREEEFIPCHYFLNILSSIFKIFELYNKYLL